ncbi:MAG: hypothetical protein ABI683_10920 [Ginsengibacter sp.]
MRKLITGFMSLAMLVLFTHQGMAQKKEMTWTTKSKEARELAKSGAHHLMNAEFEQAYSDVEGALKLDPNLTPALVLMTNLSRGASREAYAERAIKSAVGKTEGEKLFASLADKNNTAEMNRETWTKLHTMFPDGKMIGDFYVQTRATPEERFAAAEEYIKKFPDEPAMYNTIAYYYMLNKKDNDMAKKNLDRYIALYPDGSNPYDSMGEYYFNNGDMENSKKYYKMSLEKYPFANSSLTALQKIEDSTKTNDSK